MNRVPAIAIAMVAGAGLSMAQSQYSARSVTPKVPGLTTASTSGGFQGADDCNAAHTNAGTGDVFGVPFTTGTTGTTGQNEANCYFFGTTGVDQDVWYDWTAGASGGNARVTSCNGTGVDTKIAVWPQSTCPADGTSLACNDDACGLQSTTVWSATAGTTYTLQVGTFPGASGGAGTFDVTVTAPPACGQYDDGTTENALGLTAGGEMGWYQSFTCTSSVTGVQTAYGTLMFPGSVTNGNASRVAVYDDTDGDPNAGASLAASTTTVVVNGDTDILNSVAISGSAGGGTLGLLATADHLAGEFPGPMDQDNPTPTAWVVGSTLGPGTMDIANLANNNVPPMNMSAIGFPAAWLLRAESGGVVEPGTKVCFGDGSGAPCGCGNESNPGDGGCLNGLGVAGLLGGSGTADTTADTVVLECTGVRSQPGLFFQGNNTIGGGTGQTFGDGVRCCGQNVVRLEVVVPPMPQPATATLSVTITNTGPSGTVNPGDKKCYQYWYRDPGSSPCGSNFNLSNAYTVTWS